MSNKEWIKLIKENEEKLIDKIIECDKMSYSIQYSVLIYTDGDVCFVPNHNNCFVSRKKEAYIIICNINNELRDYSQDEIDDDDYVDWAQSLIDIRIYQIENEM